MEGAAAPALLLGCTSPLTLSFWLICSVSLAYFHPLEGHHSAGPLPMVVWEVPAHLGYVYDISPCYVGGFHTCRCCPALS
jgi:hypothetical protein